MGSAKLTEQLVEDMAAEQCAGMGVAVARGVEIDDSGDRFGLEAVILAGRLRAAIGRLNPALDEPTIDGIIRTLSRPPHPTLAQNNRWFHSLLTDGVQVEYRDAKTREVRGGRARLIDFEDPSWNDFVVVRQLTVQGPSGKAVRPDLVLFFNGLPLVIIELKDPANTQADLNMAIDQLWRYRQVAPDLFVPNVLLAVSDGLLTRVGSITSGPARFSPWRPVEGGEPTLEALIRGLLAPAALLDYLRTAVAFEEDERDEIAKKIAGYHQFRRCARRGRVCWERSRPPSAMATAAAVWCGIRRDRARA